MIPSAIQYGMPMREFWHDDPRLLQAYEKAYYRDRHYTAWVNGSYHLVAIGTALSDKPKPYPSFVDPIKDDKKDDIKVTRDNLEEVFRKQQLSQNSWYNNLIKK